MPYNRLGGLQSALCMAIGLAFAFAAPNLIFALVALAVTWALSAGLRAQRDLAEIV